MRLGPLVGRWAPALLAAFLPIALVLPGAAQDAPSTNPPAAEIRLDDTPTTDAAIARRIRAILAEIEGFSNVSVTVNAGVVELDGRVLESTDSERLETLVGRVDGVVTVENRVEETTALGDRLDPALGRFAVRFEQTVAYLPLLLVAFAVFVVIVAAGIVATRAAWPFDRVAPNAFIADIYRQIVRIAFVLAGLVVALDILGAMALIGTVLGAAGIVGLAIGFAVRDTVENFVASVMLSMRQPFRPNDFVEIDGDQGNVIRLTSRATILLSLDGNHIRIPNATVFKSKVVNFTRNPDRRFEFDVGIDAEADLGAALEVGRDAVAALPFVLADPPARAWIEAIGDSNVLVRLSGWIDQRATDFIAARSEGIRVTKVALEAAGFGLPEPIYRLRFDGGVPIAAAGDVAASPPARRTRPPVEVEADASAAVKDEAIEQKVAEERSEAGGRDLLSPDADIE